MLVDNSTAKRLNASTLYFKRTYLSLYSLGCFLAVCRKCTLLQLPSKSRTNLGFVSYCDSVSMSQRLGPPMKIRMCCYERVVPTLQGLHLPDEFHPDDSSRPCHPMQSTSHLEHDTFFCNTLQAEARAAAEEEVVGETTYCCCC